MKIERLELSMLAIARYLRRENRRLVRARPVTLQHGEVAYVIMHVEEK